MGARTVDVIRDAVDAGGAEDLARLDIKPGEHYMAIWRTRKGVSVKPLSAPVGTFLLAVVEGCDAHDAIGNAIRDRGLTNAVDAIRAELLTSSFVRVTQPAKQEVTS